MRLTLRTLLAYRDGVLNESDRNTLSSKLRESATARGISNRIDESLKNPKLAPIPADAKDPWFDANQIADYLDDTSPTETVAEVERRCLENNALLSEVASCHSILSRALIETVEIPETLKARIKSLPIDPQLGRTELRIERAIEPLASPSSDVLPVSENLDPASGTQNAANQPAANQQAANQPAANLTPLVAGGALAHPDGFPGAITTGANAGGTPREMVGTQRATSTISNSHIIVPATSTVELSTVESSNPLLTPKGSHVDKEKAGTSSTQAKMETLSVAKGIDARPEPRGRGIELNDGLGSQVPEYLRSSDRGRLKPILGVASLLIGIVVTGTLALGSLETVGHLLAPSHIARSDGKRSDQPSRIDRAASKSNARADSPVASTNANASSVTLEGDDQAKSASEKIVGDNSGLTTSDTAIASSTDTVVAKPAINSDGTVPELDGSEARSAIGDSLVQAGGSEFGITWLPINEENARSLVFVAANAKSIAKAEPGSHPSKWHLAVPNQKLHNATWVFPFVHRTEIAISSGLKAILCGDTELSSGASDTDKDLVGDSQGDLKADQTKSENKDLSVTGHDADEMLAMSYGRVLLFPSQEMESTRIKLPVGIIEIKFNAIDSSCAIESGTRVKSWDWMPGTNEPAILNRSSLQLEYFVDVIGIQGEMSCRLVEAFGSTSKELVAKAEEAFEVGDVVRITNEGIHKDVLLNAPSWLKSNSERAIDNLAIKDLQRALLASPESKSEPEAMLIDLSKSRKPETASMATRLLFQLGNFNHFAGADSVLTKRSNFAHTSIWLDKIPDFLYSAVRLNAFQESLQSQVGESFPLLARLLFPMTNEQLSEGGDKFLVDSLSSKDLPNRLLAIQQLTGILNTNLGYHPDRTNGEAIEAWGRMLSDGEIRRGGNVDAGGL